MTSFIKYRANISVYHVHFITLYFIVILLDINLHVHVRARTSMNAVLVKI